MHIKSLSSPLIYENSPLVGLVQNLRDQKSDFHKAFDDLADISSQQPVVCGGNLRGDDHVEQ